MSKIDKDAPTLVTGGSGLVGQHLLRVLKELGYSNVLSPSHKELDLSNVDEVDAFFAKHQPTYVFSLAALVGGILDNKIRPADFFWINSQIGNITFKMSAKHGIRKLICAGAGCGYPLNAAEPLKEDTIWDGKAQSESAPYSTAKKTLVIQSEAYYQQYGLNSSVIIPSNIYGEYDNFHLEKSHVIPALVHKFYLAKKNGGPLNVWGDGSAKRDFLYAEDFVRALEMALAIEGSHTINVASGMQTAIRDVCTALKNIGGGNVDIEFDTSKPSGQHSREFSIEKAKKLMPDWGCKYSLEEGLDRTLHWFGKAYEAGTVRI